MYLQPQPTGVREEKSRALKEERGSAREVLLHLEERRVHDGWSFLRGQDQGRGIMGGKGLQ